MKDWQLIDKGRRWEILTIFFLFLIVTFLPLIFLNKMFFIMGLLWPFVLAEKNVEEKIRSRRYRFSFLKVAFKVQQFFYFISNLKDYKFKSAAYVFVRALSPFLLSMIFFLIAGDGNPLITILGSLAFEGVKFRFPRR